MTLFFLGSYFLYTDSIGFSLVSLTQNFRTVCDKFQDMYIISSTNILAESVVMQFL